MKDLQKEAHYPTPVGGCLVPKEYIKGVSISNLERILGFRPGRLKNGVVIVQLDFLPNKNELEYYGDTRVPTDKFESRRATNISKDTLIASAYQYLLSGTKLVKVIPLDDPYSEKKENQEWIPGIGAMQYRLKSGIRKRAKIIDIIEDYPNGKFKGI